MTLQRAQFVLLAGLISALAGCVHTKTSHTGCGAHAQCCQCQCGCQAPQAQWTYQVPPQVPGGAPAELPLQAYPAPPAVLPPGALPPKSAYEEDVPPPPPPTSALPVPGVLR